MLVASQILGGLGVAIGIALAPMLATEVTGSEALSGLAPTASVTGTALLSLPLAALMTSRGRRPGLVLAYLIGALGGALVVLAHGGAQLPAAAARHGRVRRRVLRQPPGPVRGRRPGRAGAAGPGDLHRRLGHHDRLGAGPQHRRPGRPACSAGPGTRDARAPSSGRPVAFLLAGVIVAVLLRPDPLLTARALAPRRQQGERKRSLRAGVAAVRESPMAKLALVTVTVSHTAMVSIMVMTPVDLGEHGAGLQLIGLVISGHIAGMYAFSPVMGWLADRFGRLSVIGLAVGLLSCAALLAGTAGPRHGQTAAGPLRARPRLVGGDGRRFGAAHRLRTAGRPGRRAGPVRPDHERGGGHRRGGGRSDRRPVAGYGWLNAIGAALLLPVAALALRRSLKPSAAGA